ncbi:Transcriptional regulator, TetR family [[Actinomadura] parvosata subsp. kistnae]|uniref:TetR family transcriptional regulator n=2 Tax=Nonomuraea TaxID=83681 RepID=A0A1V0ADU1_9ACTN|nr:MULTISPECIES: TetR/AcrR family transcriptional regulator [unclassified Nonomuraea]AQZ68356.1 TetR family transcriptional regulator [Nonomuraea sp. ATCC 55076]NJP93778.1 TetR/AcrR family transcriptional regulator [Nonomuraea sp. FMUSA5-5]SPL93210.1 Transcriptional regulator, TetR family [Actinomadura parvosata subsp. kistnae]
MSRSTRERIIDEALRLFAERGYSATSVAEIEAASGLSPGAGGLYRHFKSKYEVLAAAINEHASRTRLQVAGSLAELSSMEASVDLEERLAHVCRAGLAKVREESELTRVFFRDLSQFPELVAVVREGLLQPMFDAIVTWFQAQPEYRDVKLDWAGIATVLGGSVVHYRLFQETVGELPGHAEKDQFVAAWVRLAVGLLPSPAPVS